ncbi:gins1 [Scenedesmus sp. PABB004]|nr:gins1 [Scenedesmus sp. PABB004]
MAELTRRATALIKEMLTADGKLPAYNEDVVRQAVAQLNMHQQSIQRIVECVRASRAARVRPWELSAEHKQQQDRERRQRQQQQQQQEPGEASDGGAAEQQPDEGGDDALPWKDKPELAGAVMVHHAACLKLKRILLTYHKMRADVLVKVRWQQRFLSADVKENMSPQEQQFYSDYDAALNRYMGHEGVGMDLTLDLTPPKDANVRVMVLRDAGSIACSHSASVPLVRGSVHNLRCSEAEHLVRMGVLRVLDPNA